MYRFPEVSNESPAGKFRLALIAGFLGMTGSSHKLTKTIKYLCILLNRLGLWIESCYGLELIVISGKHIRAARALLGWTQSELSKKSKVALGTIRRMEDFDGPVGARTERLVRL
jgi:hypothetical protein